MIRNLKALGLALLAVLAMSAVAAQGASAATGHFTPEDASFTGEDTEGGNALTGLLTVECEHGTYDGTVLTTSTATVKPTYTGCHAGERPATVTMNDCDYEFHLGTGAGGPPPTYPLTADLECDEKDVEIHIYKVETPTSEHDHSFGKEFCHVTIGQQTGLTGLTAKDEGTNVHITGTTSAITGSAKGNCTAGLTVPIEAELDVNVDLHGADIKTTE